MSMNISDMPLLMMLATKRQIAILAAILLLTRFIIGSPSTARGRERRGAFKSALCATDVIGVRRDWGADADGGIALVCERGRRAVGGLGGGSFFIVGGRQLVCIVGVVVIEQVYDTVTRGEASPSHEAFESITGQFLVH